MSDTVSGALGPTVQSLGDLSRAADNSGSSWTGGSWWQQLQPGSWRGVPFVLDAAQNKAGRRVAVHEYPYRDTVWAEDLGKLPRRFGFQVFLTGDEVYQTRDRMIRACEQPGAGTLVHPTMGAMQVVCVDFDANDRRDRGRYVEVSLAFVQAGDVLYPDASKATGQAVLAKAAAVMPAATADLKRSTAALPVLPTVRQSNGTTQQYAGMAVTAVNDPTRAFNAVRGLQGYYGRYSSGSRGTIQTGTVQSALSASITSRNGVLVAADSLISVGARL